MGLLVNGQWHTNWYDTKANDGQFVRSVAAFRHWVTSDGQPGPSGEGGFKAEAGRYHLYVSLACPWAHRTLIFRKLKGLEKIIDISVVNSFMGNNGWTFEEGADVVADTVNHKTFLHQLYTQAMPKFSGRVTVPVLWDKERATIVNNESSEIIRMFNSAFSDIATVQIDYYPNDNHEVIDAMNDHIYHAVNNGVYKTGFATSTASYTEAVSELFIALDSIEAILSQQRYLVGSQITEADWRLFTTLIRFDAVYVGHFKCNIRRIADYPSLSNYLRDLYQQPGIAETVNIDNCKAHYYASHDTINPTRIIPAGPELDFDAPHDRNRIF